MKNYLASVVAVLVTAVFFCRCSPSLSVMQPAMANGGRAVAVSRHPTSDNQMIVAAETGGLFKTTNGGADWSQVSGSTSFDYSDIIYDPANPNTLVATAYPDTRNANGGGIWRSTNSGGSWVQISLPATPTGCSGDLSVNCIDVEPGSGRFWAGSSCGVLYSDDHGATWTWLNATSGYYNERVVALLAPVAGHLKMLSDEGVKVSNDDGADWTLSPSMPFGFSTDVHNQIACSPLNDQHLFFSCYYYASDNSTHRGLFQSSDNGSTWTNLYDAGGVNRPTFVRTAHSLSGNSNQFDLYFSDGACLFQRATFKEGTTPSMVGSWTSMNLDHCDGSDLAFSADGKTPLLFTSDGGVSTTTDQGAHWHMTGAGAHGYNALQITECTGQRHSGDNKSDLYFATQDNNINASPDEGATWPGVLCCEGFYLGVSRSPLGPGQTKFTGVSCSGCSDFISDPVLSGVGAFPDPPNNAGNPLLLAPATYIQNTQISGLSDNIFDLTTNTGGTWTPRYGFSEAARDISRVSANGSDPVIFCAARLPGATPGGQEVIGIKKIVGTLDAGSPVVSTISGFGSLGTFPTMFAWYKPYGVDPFDPNHLIVPDIIDSVMRVTTDGGASWQVDSALTKLVTGAGVYRFTWGGFTQLSNIGFDPDVAGHILVGTVQAGIFTTCDNGHTWSKVKNSELLPNVSSFYFDGNKSVIISTYGRGLWKYNYDACPTVTGPRISNIVAAEPLIYWKGAYVPISQINDPEVCPVCGFYIVQAGDIVQYVVNADNAELTSVTLSSGQIAGISTNGSALTAPFSTSILSDRQVAQAGIPDQQMLRLMRNNNLQIKGVYLDGKVLKGFLLSAKDVRPDQLPKPAQPKPRVFVDWKTYLLRDSGQVNAIRVYATGLDRQSSVTFKMDGKTLKQDSALQFDEKGTLAHVLNVPLRPGGHTLLIEQRKGNQIIYREAYTFIISIPDKKPEK